VKRKRPAADQAALFETAAHVPTTTKRAVTLPPLQPSVAHYCMWPGCQNRIPSIKLMCTIHWYKLPDGISSGITRAAAAPNGTTSPHYEGLLRSAMNWIATEGGGPVVPTPDVVRTEATP
jgi:hypothetical protein